MDGWPLAAGLATSVARSHGWPYSPRRLADPARALDTLRVDRGNTPQTSVRLAPAESLEGLSRDAIALLRWLSGQDTSAVGDYDAALMELTEVGLARIPVSGASIPRLLELYVAEIAELHCAS